MKYFVAACGTGLRRFHGQRHPEDRRQPLHGDYLHQRHQRRVPDQQPERRAPRAGSHHRGQGQEDGGLQPSGGRTDRQGQGLVLRRRAVSVHRQLHRRHVLRQGSDRFRVRAGSQQARQRRSAQLRRERQYHLAGVEEEPAERAADAKRHALVSRECHRHGVARRGAGLVRPGQRGAGEVDINGLQPPALRCHRLPLFSRLRSQPDEYGGTVANHRPGVRHHVWRPADLLVHRTARLLRPRVSVCTSRPATTSSSGGIGLRRSSRTST